MNSKRVKQIIGVGVIVVVIAGVIFLFTRLNKPVEEPEPMQTTPQFATEETVDNPALLEEEDERKWEEVIPSEEMTLKTITDTYLHVQPFADTDTTIKVPINSEFIEEATCFQGSVPLNWSKVTYNGVTGYVELCDTEYVLPEVEEELPEVPEEQEGVSDEEQHSIVTPKEEEATPTPDAEPTEDEEPTPEQTSTPEPTPAPKEETPKAETPKAEAQPSPAPTQNPNVTTKTEADKQAELQQQALEKLKSLGFTETPPTTDRGLVGGSGTGTKYGDLQ